MKYFLLIILFSLNLSAGESWNIQYEDWTCYAGTFYDEKLPQSTETDTKENSSFCDLQRNFYIKDFDEYYSIILAFNECNFEESNQNFMVKVNKYKQGIKQSEMNYENLTKSSDPVKDLAYRLRLIPEKLLINGEDINSTKRDSKSHFIRLLSEQTSMSITVGLDRRFEFNLTGVAKAIRAKCLTYDTDNK